MILATGPMGSGTRLLYRVLEASGHVVVHDASHGTGHYSSVDAVVAIVRDPAETCASRASHTELCFDDWPGRQQSLAGIAAHYPDALYVTYEHLCDNPDGVIAYLAARLDLEPWPMPEPIVTR